MKKVLRSLVFKDQKEVPNAIENLSKMDIARFVHLTPAEQAVLEWVLEFYQKSGQAPTLSVVHDHFQTLNKVEETVLMEDCLGVDPELGSSFDTLIEYEIEAQSVRRLSTVCKQAMKIASHGETVKNTTIIGCDAAVSWLYSELKGKPSKDEGKIPANMTKAAVALDTLYQDRKNNPQKTYGVLTGYGLIDSATAGIRKKQLYIHAGFSGHLKSTHAMNMIVNSVVDGGWNAIMFTSEMPAQDVMLMMIAIHSANKRFQTVAKPLSAYRLLLGALHAPEEKFFKVVKDDLLSNSDHGSIRVVDAGEFTTFGSIQQRVFKEHMEEEIDVLWIDYLTRLPVDTKYRSIDVTTAKNETIADAKRFAMSFNKGEGLAVCSPFQINREGFKRARDHEGKIDVISYIFYGEDEVASCEPKVGMMKSRWGHVPAETVSLFIEPDSRRLMDMSAGMSVQSVAPTSGGEQSVEL